MLTLILPVDLIAEIQPHLRQDMQVVLVDSAANLQCYRVGLPLRKECGR